MYLRVERGVGCPYDTFGNRRPTVYIVWCGFFQQGIIGEIHHMAIDLVHYSMVYSLVRLQFWDGYLQLNYTFQSKYETFFAFAYYSISHLIQFIYIFICKNDDTEITRY